MGRPTTRVLTEEDIQYIEKQKEERKEKKLLQVGFAGYDKGSWQRIVNKLRKYFECLSILQHAVGGARKQHIIKLAIMEHDETKVPLLTILDRICKEVIEKYAGY